MDEIPQIYGVSVITLSLALITVLATFVTFLRKRHNHWTSSNSPPGPRGIPLLGHLPLLGSKPHLKFTEWSKTYGDIFRIDFGSHPTVIISGLNTIRSIIKTSDPDVRRAISGRPPFPTFAHINHGYSMTTETSAVPEWSNRKRWLRQTVSNFTSQNIKTLEASTISRADELADKLQDASIVNPGEHISGTCVSTILDMISFNSRQQQQLQNNTFVKKILAAFLQLSKMSITPIPDLYPKLATFFRKSIRTVQAATTAIADLFSELLRCNVETYDKTDLRDMADHLLKVISNDSNNNEVSYAAVEQRLGLFGEFMGATESTVGTILRWAMLYAATHKEEQELMRKEIHEVVGQGSVTLEHQKKLVRTRAFIAEIMRKCVILPFLLPHWTTEDTKIGSYDVPKDTMVFFNVWSALHDPEEWEKPETFDPSRFIDDSCEFRYEKLYSFLHFGGGERRCLGQRIGQWIVYLTFANLIQRCVLSPVADEKYNFEGRLEFNLTPGDYRIKVQPVVS